MIYKKTIYYLLALLLLPLLTFSQSRNFWDLSVQEPAKEEMLPSKMEISKYATIGLELDAFKNFVLQAPFRGNGVSSSVVVAFPNAKGEFKAYELFKVHTMSPELAQKFPSISSYVGITKDKNNRIRVTLTKQGIYGMITGEKGRVYINPMTNSGSLYKVFNRENASSETNYRCLVDEASQPLPANNSQNRVMADDGILRTYDLAIAATGEFSQYHVNLAGTGGGTTAQQKASVLAAITVIIDRVNEVYEKALAVSFTLVANNEDIIFLNGSTDPFTDSSSPVLINESQTVIDNQIGSANYDMGHTFGRFTGGGLAQLFSVCTANKARGVSGIFNPVGDIFAVDFVSHEFGHQFGANHTQNNNCQRNPQTAVEPGSGCTIMGYAGICPPNIQNNSEGVFHATSIAEMYNNIRFGPASSCPTETTISNTAPTVTPIPNYTIPYGTAFVLTASATDPEGDALTYTYDQTDNEIATMPPSPTSTQGPNFRSFAPGDAPSSPTRYFPDLGSILANNLTPTWEVIPNVARVMSFALTVRDNNILGGQSSVEYYAIVFANTGPFVVTSQNSTGISYDQNVDVTVTWDVAGTTGNNINAATVDIKLSYFAGSSFPVILANDVPNDGSHVITTPIGTASGICKLMVKASDNIFFDVNNQLFTITDELAVVDEFSANSFSIMPNPNNGQFTLTFDAAMQGKNIQTTIYDIRGRLISKHNFSTNNGLEKTIKMEQAQSGIYLLQISDGEQKITKKLIVK